MLYKDLDTESGCVRFLWGLHEDQSRCTNKPVVQKLAVGVAMDDAFLLGITNVCTMCVFENAAE